MDKMMVDPSWWSLSSMVSCFKEVLWHLKFRKNFRHGMKGLHTFWKNNSSRHEFFLAFYSLSIFSLLLFVSFFHWVFQTVILHVCTEWSRIVIEFLNDWLKRKLLERERKRKREIEREKEKERERKREKTKVETSKRLVSHWNETFLASMT